jgi:hypothetical protein
VCVCVQNVLEVSFVFNFLMVLGFYILMCCVPVDIYSLYAVFENLVC